MAKVVNNSNIAEILAGDKPVMIDLGSMVRTMQGSVSYC